MAYISINEDPRFEGRGQKARMKRAFPWILHIPMVNSWSTDYKRITAWGHANLLCDWGHTHGGDDFHLYMSDKSEAMIARLALGGHFRIH